MENFITATVHEIAQAEAHHALKKLKKINTPFGYFGSKNKMAFQLAEKLPPHTCWVEGFCGSGALTLAKRRAPIEVINDIDGEIVNVFRQLRNNQDEICRLISLTPYADEEFEKARVPIKGDSEMERARKFLIQAMMAVNGAFGEGKGGFSFSNTYSRNEREARVNRWYNLPDRLALVVERLRDVRIENRDAIELLDMFVKRPATLFYLDPPYLAERINGYTNEANNDEFHINLLKMCLKSKCMIFISGYEHEVYTEILTRKRGWSKRKIEASTKNEKGDEFERDEVVWTNSVFNLAAKTGELPLRLTKAELSENKLNPERK